jgi:hypothetical protein
VVNMSVPPAPDQVPPVLLVESYEGLQLCSLQPIAQQLTCRVHVIRYRLQAFLT